MKQRFPTVAFILATLIHLAGTSALFAASFRTLAEWKRTAMEPDSASLTVFAWLWEPLPVLLRLLFPSLSLFYGPILFVWSLCVGAFFGFLLPRFFLTWRRRFI